MMLGGSTRKEKEMSLVKLIRLWDLLHDYKYSPYAVNTGELTFCGLCNAIEETGIVIRNDVIGGTDIREPSM